MDTAQKAKDFSELQDVFGPLMRLILYTPICVCFPLQDDSSQSQITEILTRGLKKIADGFPWLAGQVAADKDTKLPMIIPGDKTCRLLVKDHTDDSAVPPMDTLRDARFPFSMLDGRALHPIGDLPNTWDDAPAPVFLLQANFIKGGLLLCFLGEHSTMDGVGLGRIVHMFSKACHGESFTEEEILQGNRVRTNIIPLLDQANLKPGPDLNHMFNHITVQPGRIPTYEYKNPPKSTFAYFHFSASSQARLKSLAAIASGSIPDNPMVTYTTTNDAVSAFIWKSTARIRASHLPPDAISMFARAVDARSCLSIPASYLGNMTHHTRTTLPVSTADSVPLSTLASTLRSALNQESMVYGIRSLATFLTIKDPTRKISYGADFNAGSDIWFSSWAKLDTYRLDFNLGLGFPEAVRKPRFETVEGLMYLMPMGRDGSVDVAICLRDGDLERLKGDEQWKEFAEWIG